MGALSDIQKMVELSLTVNSFYDYKEGFMQDDFNDHLNYYINKCEEWDCYGD